MDSFYVELFCKPKNLIAHEQHHELFAKCEHSKHTALCRGNVLLLCPRLGPLVGQWKAEQAVAYRY